MLVKTGAWYHGGMAKPVQLDVDTGSDTSSIKAEHSPPYEKKARIYDRDRQHPDSGQSSEKENIAQIPSQQRDRDRDRDARDRDGKAPISRSGSVLKRQYSMSDANMGKGSSGHGGDRTQSDQQDPRLRDRTDPRGSGDPRARSYDPMDPRDPRMRGGFVHPGDSRHDMPSSQSQGELHGTDPRSAQDLRGRRTGGIDPLGSQRHRHHGDMQEGAQQHSTRAENRVDSKHDRHYSEVGTSDQFQSERISSAERDRSRLERRSSVERRQDLNHSDPRQRDRDSRERDRSRDHVSDRSHMRDTSPHRGDPHSVRDRPPSRERYARDDPRRPRDDSRHRYVTYHLTTQ